MSYQGYIQQALNNIYGQKKKRQYNYGGYTADIKSYLPENYTNPIPTYNKIQNNFSQQQGYQQQSPYSQALQSQYNAQPYTPIAEQVAQPRAIQGYQQMGQITTQPTPLQDALKVESAQSASPYAGASWNKAGPNSAQSVVPYLGTPEGLNYYANTIYSMVAKAYPNMSPQEMQGTVLQRLLQLGMGTAFPNVPIRFSTDMTQWATPGNIQGGA